MRLSHIRTVVYLHPRRLRDYVIVAFMVVDG
jgi:hypothetical protein